MKLLLVCNYAPDDQQSMLRFGALLHAQLTARGHRVHCLAPESGRLQQRAARTPLGKWAGYADKYLRFPTTLREALHAGPAADADLVHVVDHSNALYVPAHRDRPWLVTCHDLLAVRGALGEDTDCPASFLGRRLQRTIVRGLARADALACDSASTQRDADRLVPGAGAQPRRVIPLGLNQPLQPVPAAEARARLAALDARLAAAPFVLHVGSNLARKNKPGVLRVFARMRQAGWPGLLVFCGAPLTPELAAQARALGHFDDIVALPHATEAELAALYSAAHALLFPSKCEGFGWPVLEALACGCPVVGSDRTSLPEVGGDAAQLFPFDDEAGMAAAALRLTDDACRAPLVARGRAHAAGFSVDRMVDAYVELYEEMRRVRRP